METFKSIFGNTRKMGVFSGNKKELGFTVIRVLGNDMKPENAMEFLSILQKSNIDMEQLKPILNFVNKK